MYGIFLQSKSYCEMCVSVLSMSIQATAVDTSTNFHEGGGSGGCRLSLKFLPT